MSSNVLCRKRENKMCLKYEQEENGAKTGNYQNILLIACKNKHWKP